MPPTLSYQSPDRGHSPPHEPANSRWGLTSFILCNLTVSASLIAILACIVLDALAAIPTVLWGAWALCTFLGIPLAIAGFFDRWRRRKYAFAGLAMNAGVTAFPLWGRVVLSHLGF